jgi:hypothetical protein
VRWEPRPRAPTAWGVLERPPGPREPPPEAKLGQLVQRRERGQQLRLERLEHWRPNERRERRAAAERSGRPELRGGERLPRAPLEREPQGAVPQGAVPQPGL